MTETPYANQDRVIPLSENLVAVEESTTDKVHRVRLVRCPSCKKDFGDPTAPGHSPVNDHIAKHDPEDFGLSPLGQRRVKA